MHVRLHQNIIQNNKNSSDYTLTFRVGAIVECEFSRRTQRDNGSNCARTEDETIRYTATESPSRSED